MFAIVAPTGPVKIRLNLIPPRAENKVLHTMEQLEAIRDVRVALLKWETAKFYDLIDL